MRWISGSLILAAALAAAAEGPAEPPGRFAPLGPPAFSEAERGELESGAVVVHELPTSDGRGIGVLTMGVVAAPPAAVWAVMSDCDRQDEFLPRVLTAVVSDRHDGSHTCELVLDLPYPLHDARTASRHHQRRLPDGGYQRWWRLLPGDWDYERNRGSWSVHPFPDGQRSLLVSRMELLPKTAFPGWILRVAQSHQAPATFEAIRVRVATRSATASQ